MKNLFLGLCISSALRANKRRREYRKLFAIPPLRGDVKIRISPPLPVAPLFRMAQQPPQQGWPSRDGLLESEIFDCPRFNELPCLSPVTASY